MIEMVGVRTTDVSTSPLAQQLPELLLGTRSAAEQHHRIDVREGAEVVVGAGAAERLGDHEHGVVAHRLADDPQDLPGRLVRPVVQDRLEQIGVGPGGYLGAEVARDDRAPVGDRALGQPPSGLRGDVRLVQERRPHPGAVGQQPRDERAVAAADVHHAGEPVPVVGVQDGAQHLRVGALRRQLEPDTA
jgi:hypothetical protein